MRVDASWNPAATEIGLFLFGVVMVVIGVASLLANRNRRGRADGVVVAVPSRILRDGSKAYTAVVSFTDAWQHSFTFTARISTPPSHRAGESVLVAYDLSGRRPPRIAKDGQVVGPLLGVLGVVLMAAGAGLAVH